MTPVAVAYALDLTPRVPVQSDLLGPLTVAPTDILKFPHGLFGFPECRSFVLVPAQRDGVYWLQSVDHSALVFLLVDPFITTIGYSVELAEPELRELEAREPADIAVLAIVTLPRSRDEQPTANLQGPLAMNLRAGVGKQIVFPDSDFGVRCPITLPG